jgi:hypothetical protein
VIALATTPRAEENTLGFNQSVHLLKSFKQHLAVLAEPRLLELLSLANTMPITNEDARAVLKVGRRGAYYWLSELTRLTMLEKHGQTYRASPYSKALMATASATFGSLMLGKAPKVPAPVDPKSVPALSTVLQTAAEGLEVLYSRGRIDQAERARRQKVIDDLRLELNAPPA